MDEPSTPNDDLLERLCLAPSLVLLLDYDGTLVPFAATPDEASPDARLCGLLTDLAGRDRTHVHVVSGRDRVSLERWLGALPIEMHAEHGYWMRRSTAPAWSTLDDLEVDPAEIALLLAAVLRITETVGGRVERKYAGVVWHFRGEALESEDVTFVHDALRRVVGVLGYEVLAGDCILEVRRRGVHKGLVADRVRAWHGDQVTIAAFGDDHTDEDLFRALPAGSISVKVGTHASIATHRVPDYQSVRSLLADLLGRSNRCRAQDHGAPCEACAPLQPCS